MKALLNTDFTSVITARKSALAFSADPIAPEIINQIFEAARWAPSAFNEQPWRFIYANKTSNPAGYKKLFNLMAPFNQAWATHAPLLVLVTAKSTYSHNDQINHHARYDTGQAASTLVLAATGLGLESHQLAGFDREKAVSELRLDEDFDPIAMIAIGYKGDETLLNEALQQRARQPRTRRPLEDIVKQVS